MILSIIRNHFTLRKIISKKIFEKFEDVSVLGVPYNNSTYPSNGSPDQDEPVLTRFRTAQHICPNLIGRFLEQRKNKNFKKNFSTEIFDGVIIPAPVRI